MQKKYSRVARLGLNERQAKIIKKGPLAYSTSGWLGLSDDDVIKSITQLRNQGFRHFKAKVGGNLADDRRRLSMLRRIIGADGHLMTDANQIWSVNEAIDWMTSACRVPSFLD